MATFWKYHCQQIEIGKAVLAVAGPVEGNRCVLTNCSLAVDARELCETFRLEARIINDFEAVAYSLPSLAPSDVVGIGGGKAALRAPMAVLGPGSGLGVACLVPGIGKPIVISSAGEHATLAGASDREDEIIKQIVCWLGEHLSGDHCA